MSRSAECRRKGCPPAPRTPPQSIRLVSQGIRAQARHLRCRQVGFDAAWMVGRCCSSRWSDRVEPQESKTRCAAACRRMRSLIYRFDTTSPTDARWCEGWARVANIFRSSREGPVGRFGLYRSTKPSGVGVRSMFGMNSRSMTITSGLFGSGLGSTPASGSFGEPVCRLSSDRFAR